MKKTNKENLKSLSVLYLILFIIGIAALIAVDWIQLYIPEFLGEVVDILQNGGDKLNRGIWILTQNTMFMLLLGFMRYWIYGTFIYAEDFAPERVRVAC